VATEFCGSLFSHIDLEKRVRADHPLRVIRQSPNAALKSLSGEFAKLYSPIARESIQPERLMRALLLQAFYSIRSERQLVERIDYDLLFRWPDGLSIEDAVWDATSFTKNRDRLLAGAVAGKFLAAVLSQDKVKRLLSSEHFLVDGTLLEAWVSPKSFRPKDGSDEPPGLGAMASATSVASAAGTTRTSRPPTPTPVSSAKGVAKSSALFHRPRADGEPQRLDRPRGDNPRFGPCRASGGVGADRAACRPAGANHAGNRQGV
jgi:transposase